MKKKDLFIGMIINKNLEVVGEPFMKGSNAKVTCKCLLCGSVKSYYLSNLPRIYSCRDCSNVRIGKNKVTKNKLVQKELKVFCKRHSLKLEFKNDKMFVNGKEVVYKYKTFVILESGKKLFEEFYKWKRENENKQTITCKRR